MSRLVVLRVFTADGCPHCRAIIDDMVRRRVRFEEVNLSRTPDALAELQRVCWEHRLPVVVDRDKVSVGFRGRSTSFSELGLE